MVRTSAGLGTLVVLVGCGAAAPFHPSAPSFEVAAASPLGKGYVLLPRSNDDRSLLGKVLAGPPDGGRPLEEVARVNECADKLAAPKEEPVISTFEDAQALAAGGRARPALGPFGFDDDAAAATHFYYKLDIEKRASLAITPEYTACCTEKGTCGYGVVTALGYGQGEFAVLAENNVGASVQVPASGEEKGFVNGKFLRKRYVYGYVAALVSVSDPAASKPLSLLGDPSVAAVDPKEQDLSEAARARFERDKIEIVPHAGADAAFAYAFRDGDREISENEFVRRYQALTGALDLSDAKRNRNPFWLYYGISAVSVSAFLLGTAAYLTYATPTTTESFGTNMPTMSSVSPSCNFSTLQNVVGSGYQMQCSPPLNPGLGRSMAITGGALLGTGIASFVVYGVLGYDGSSGDHVITKADADTYVGRYNRALLRGSARGMLPAATPAPATSGHDLAPQVQLMPVISPMFTGVVGRF